MDARLSKENVEFKSLYYRLYLNNPAALRAMMAYAKWRKAM